ncbi:hypothetical protein TURU_126998 [Turdus rufiventris]|nr:hypothetical protein TURU_126998 [Turdus rufiventris]
MICELKSQGVVSNIHSPFNSPIWPVHKSDGEWRLTMDYCALNVVTPSLSAAMLDILELQYELESKAAKWHATIDIANAFFSIPLAAKCRPQFAFTWRGVQNTWNQLPQGWKHIPTICHRLIQAALEKEGEDFGLADDEEQEQVTRAEEAPPYNQLPAYETRYTLFTDSSCRIVGVNRKWKVAVWSPTQQVARATEGEGGSSQLAELKAIQLALNIAEREK